MTEKQEVIKRLRSIQDEIGELVTEADELIHSYGSELAHKRAESYWLEHIRGALSGRGSMVTMEETISELEGE